MVTQKKTLDQVADKLTYALRFRKLANAIHAAPDFRALLVGLREEIIQLCEARMTTIYLVDSGGKEIYSMSMLPGDHLKEIRLPINSKSIAGYVAWTGKFVNICNVYDPVELIGIDPDLSFDASWDQKTGIKTKQLLAVPVFFEKMLLGVIELMNKRNGKRFTVEDEKCLYDLAETMGIAFRNLHRSTKRTPTRYDMLIKDGVLSEQELADAQAMARKRQKDVEAVLLHELKVSREVLGNALARFYNAPFVDLLNTRYNPASLLKGIKSEYLRKVCCVPLTERSGTAIFATDNPRDQIKTQEIMQVFRTVKAEFHVALKGDIDKFITMLKSAARQQERQGHEKSFADIFADMQKQEKTATPVDVDLPVETADDHAIVQLVRKIIEDAHNRRASDIHLEPYGSKRDAEVRFRIDGRCMKFLTIPKNHIKSAVSRLKILAQLDISERRKPQDGKIRFRLTSGREIELRVSTIPTADGNEDVVLRLLGGSEPLPLDTIMPVHVFKRFSRIIRKPYGMILVVGPTGSGKTTTLHSALGYINSPTRKIWTAEDPVEITQYGLRQVQVNPKIGLTFAAAMRAFLRADPDVIMVGEMRDRETAGIGIEASLTGHLVFSTLHTNSAPETIIRLTDMGMDPFNFADGLLGILAQRLVRLLCVQCKTPYYPVRAEYDHLTGIHGSGFDKTIGTPYSDKLQLYKTCGCSSCNNTGYLGRSGLYELLLGSKSMKQMIIERTRVDEIRELAIKEEMTTLLQEGIRNVFTGATDFSQVMAVCSDF